MSNVMKKVLPILFLMLLLSSFFTVAVNAAGSDMRIYFTTIPEYGNPEGVFEGYLCTERGKRSDPDSYVIYAALSLDGERFYEKPYYGRAFSKPNETCFFSIRTVTGGYDYNARYFEFYLVTKVWSSSHESASKAEVAEAAIDHVSIERTEDGRIIASPDRKLPTLETFMVYLDPNGGSVPSKQMQCPATLPQPTKTLTITFDANGGSIDVNGGSLSRTSKAVSCTFQNWNTHPSGNGTSYKAGDTIDALSNTTLYAQWFNPLAGHLVTPKRADYNFEGWFTYPSGGSEILFSSIISDDVTLYAHWEKDKEPKTAANVITTKPRVSTTKPLVITTKPFVITAKPRVNITTKLYTENTAAEPVVNSTKKKAGGLTTTASISATDRERQTTAAEPVDSSTKEEIGSLTTTANVSATNRERQTTAAETTRRAEPPQKNRRSVLITAAAAGFVCLTVTVIVLIRKKRK